MVSILILCTLEPSVGGIDTDTVYFALPCALSMGLSLQIQTDSDGNREGNWVTQQWLHLSWLRPSVKVKTILIIHIDPIVGSDGCYSTASGI